MANRRISPSPRPSSHEKIQGKPFGRKDVSELLIEISERQPGLPFFMRDMGPFGSYESTECRFIHA